MSRSAPEDPLWWTDVRSLHRVCEHCGGPNSSSGYKYCSPTCQKEAGKRRHRECRPAQEPALVLVQAPVQSKRKPPDRPVRDCAICGRPFTVARFRTTCGKAECQRAFARAKRRNRDHAQRAAVSDITAVQEAEMRRKARDCPLCGVRMTERPHQPDSKELDHILPIAMGGTHTHGNVRIICRRCNQARPKDGRDYAGTLPLWAQGPVPVGRADGRRNSALCRKGLHPWVPENITIRSGKKRCIACLRAKERVRERRSDLRQCTCGATFPAPGRTLMCPDCIASTAHRAAELHAAGGMTWAEVARQVGYQSGEGARYAAKRIGYVAEPRQRCLMKPWAGGPASRAA